MSYPRVSQIAKIAKTVPPCVSCDHLTCEMQRSELKQTKRDNYQEIENLKRLLASISQRLDALKTS